jgi:hypothetical protein
MIRIKRGRMPAGAQAVALRQDGRIVVYVSEELSGRERLAAIQEALRAAPAAGWRRPRSPVLLPALALSAGLRQVPESRWSYRVAAAAVAGAALLITATSLATVSVDHGGVHQPAAAAAPGQPPLTGAGPVTSHSATGRGHGHGSAPSRQPGNGSPSARPGTAPKPGKTAPAGGAPAPQSSGSPAPVVTSVPTSGSSPQPSQAPSPSPSPSPSKQSGGSGACVDVLGITVCL